MTGKFYLISTLTLIAVLLIGNRFIVPYLHNQQPSQLTDSNQPTITIGNATINIEVADEPSEIQQGLSGRPSLDPDSGMLFVLSQKRIPTFWMKDMNIDLDFIWIDNDKVVDITENVLAPTVAMTDSQLPTYSPSVPVTHVLEVNAGFVKNQNIRVGDQVVFSF